MLKACLQVLQLGIAFSHRSLPGAQVRSSRLRGSACVLGLCLRYAPKLQCQGTRIQNKLDVGK